MGFKKGKDWNGNKFGRPRGSQNRSTEMMKVNVARAANFGLDTIKEDYERLREEDPKGALNLLMKLLEFNLPKLKSVDMDVKAEVNNKVEKITVEIKQRDDNKENNEE
jgi:hypothetical protein